MHPRVATQTGGRQARFVQHQQRHQRLEHAATPGRHVAQPFPDVVTAKEGVAVHGLDGTALGRLRLPVEVAREGAGHPVPVLRRRFALADGDQAAQPRFGVQQAIAVFGAVGQVDVVAVHHQLLDRIVEKAGNFRGRSIGYSARQFGHRYCESPSARRSARPNRRRK
jgi:hypothetical protein